MHRSNNNVKMYTKAAAQSKINLIEADSAIEGFLKGEKEPDEERKKEQFRFRFYVCQLISLICWAPRNDKHYYYIPRNSVAF